MTMQTKFEVQFKDGFGCWRRWSLNSTPEDAVRSIARLEAHGVRSGRVREVSKPR
jgi:hypothetical protein